MHWRLYSVPDWEVRFERNFEKELKQLDEDVRVELLAHAQVLEHRGPSLGRPLVDTLKGSAYQNMKELRFNVARGVWRVAFAFDPDSKGLLLVAGNKVGLWGKDEEAFYRRLIEVADTRFKAYLDRVEEAKKRAAARAGSGSGTPVAPHGRRRKE
jgi:hypothetical protein